MGHRKIVLSASLAFFTLVALGILIFLVHVVNPESQLVEIHPSQVPDMDCPTTPAAAFGCEVDVDVAQYIGNDITIPEGALNARILHRRQPMLDTSFRFKMEDKAMIVRWPAISIIPDLD